MPTITRAHREAPINDTHGPFGWHFDDATARLAATVTTADVTAGRCALQRDDNTIWLAIAAGTGAGSWEQVAESSPASPATTSAAGIVKISDAPATPGDPIAVGANNSAYLHWRESVRVAGPGNVNLSSPGATIDGVSLSTGDAFLAPNQTPATQCGVYIWNGASAAATRRPDFDAAADFTPGAAVLVREGDTFAGLAFRHVTSGAITLGTTPIVFEPVRAALEIATNDGATTGAVRTLRLPNGSLAISGRVATYTPATGGSISVSKNNGTPITGVTQLDVTEGANVIVTLGELSSGRLPVTIAASGGGGSTPRAHYPLAQPGGALAGSTNFVSSIPTNWNNDFNPGSLAGTSNSATDFGLLIEHAQTGGSGSTVRYAGIYNAADFLSVGSSVRALVAVEADYLFSDAENSNSLYGGLCVLENTSSLATADIFTVGIRLTSGGTTVGYTQWSSHNASIASASNTNGQFGIQYSSGIWFLIWREAIATYSFWFSGTGMTWRRAARITPTLTGTSPAIALLLSNSAAASVTDKSARLRCPSLQVVSGGPSPVGVIQ